MDEQTPGEECPVGGSTRERAGYRAASIQPINTEEMGPMQRLNFVSQLLFSALFSEKFPNSISV